LTAYERELSHVGELIGRRSVESIFFGGGTPSLMKPSTVERIIETVAKVWSLSSHAEITLEANPGSVEAGRFHGYRSAGVNRVSIGVQSLRDDDLKSLGRIHSVFEAKAAIELAVKIFERSSFDLIYARPGQTSQAWREELSEALEIAGGGHLSLYQLTIEPETPFARLHALGKLAVPDPERSLALYEITQELCEVAGLPAYEISNHAVLGQESRHNLIYWRYGEYAGIGPGAHGRLVVGGEKGRRVATSCERHPEDWVSLVEKKGHGITFSEPLDGSQQADEILLMGLRLSEGVDVGAIARVGGMKFAPHVVQELCEQGMIEMLEGGQRLRASGYGRFILNEIVCRLSLGLVPLDASA
jgi:putative oxygen-independent coproporphyrinogen III oxidase